MQNIKEIKFNKIIITNSVSKFQGAGIIGKDILKLDIVDSEIEGCFIEKNNNKFRNNNNI